MHKVLLIGRSPLEYSGNGHMMNSLARQIDQEHYTPICFGISDNRVFMLDEDKLPYRLIQTGTSDLRVLQQMLMSTIENIKPSVVIIVGLDVWDLAMLYEDINNLKRRQQFTTASIMPYDLTYFRDDWAGWFNFFDFPRVYSEYGFEMLKDHVRNLDYFRPLLDEHHIFIPDFDMGQKARGQWYVDAETFVFGFVGPNQIRKDPLRLIKAFSEMKRRTNKRVALYMHTDMDKGAYSFQSLAEDCGIRMGELISKTQGRKYTAQEMVGVFNGIDCLVNCSLQEGLSWTPLEAMLCSTPVIVSDSTSHGELVDGAGILVPTTELAFVPVITKYGSGWVESRACAVEDMVESMLHMLDDDVFRQGSAHRGYNKAMEWIAGASDINDLIGAMVTKAKPESAAFTKEDTILFAQHSAAGDVLMTTAILAEIKARHPGKRLVYMTQRQYAGILEDNDDVDEVIFWDESKLNAYTIVYNPHGQKILTGRWNTLDMRLHDMYAYFTKTKVGKAHISPVEPDVEMPSNYIVVHTTGNHYTRVYKNLNIIVDHINQLGYKLVQVGDLTDWPVKGVLDLRGELSYRQSAYVVQHAQAAIVVDSFMSHLAASMGTPQACLFGPAPARVTKPYVTDESKLICLEPDRMDVCLICGACYGDYKCSSPCINTISPFVILDVLKTLLRKD